VHLVVSHDALSDVLDILGQRLVIPIQRLFV